MCVLYEHSCASAKHFKLLSQCFECRPGNATRLGWSQGAASGQRGMLKGANMISSSHKRIPEKMLTTMKWEQPKPTDFEEWRPKAKQSHKVVRNNKIVLRTYIYYIKNTKRNQFQRLRWKNEIVFNALKKGFKKPWHLKKELKICIKRYLIRLSNKKNPWILNSYQHINEILKR